LGPQEGTGQRWKGKEEIGRGKGKAKGGEGGGERTDPYFWKITLATITYVCMHHACTLKFKKL